MPASTVSIAARTASCPARAAADTDRPPAAGQRAPGRGGLAGPWDLAGCLVGYSVLLVAKVAGSVPGRGAYKKQPMNA